jgi:hypothetical protein
MLRPGSATEIGTSTRIQLPNNQIIDQIGN